MLAICLMLSKIYYAQNCAGIISLGLHVALKSSTAFVCAMTYVPGNLYEILHMSGDGRVGEDIHSTCHKLLTFHDHTTWP